VAGLPAYIRSMQPMPATVIADAPIGWAQSPGLTDYDAALRAMQERAEAIARGEAREVVWLLEHPPLYTAGTSSRPEDLLQADRLPVHRVGRGGRLTSHGPGQRVAYLMLDIKKRGGDVRAFVRRLEAWIIGTLDDLGIAGEARAGRVGVWVKRSGEPEKEDKIAAIGLRVSRGVTTHGISINVAPDLSHYGGIVPCGIAEHGVTSLAQLGAESRMQIVDKVLRKHFEAGFGRTEAAPGVLEAAGATRASPESESPAA
jgi:lipoyl(octanoyl) transferase